MNTTGALLTGISIGLVVGIGVARVLPGESDERLRSLQAEAEETAEEIETLRRQVAEVEDLRRNRGRPAAEGTDEATDGEETGVGDAASAEAGDPVEGPSPDEVALAATRRSSVNAIRGKIRAWFDAGDGKAALAALKELAALAPEGREAAMDLAVEMNADVNGRGKLKLSMYEFYSGMGDPAVKDLMGWSLTNPSPSDFRVMSAYGLPWTQGADATVEQFSAALGGEQDVAVQRALVANMARLGKESASKALHGLFLDSNRDAQLRAQIATELALSEDTEIVRAIEQAAANDASDRVRSAAKAALVARDPPATGYLITGTVPSSQGEAAGLAPGDILVSYNGKSTATPDALRAAAKETGDAEQVSVVVVRDGQEVTVLCRPGRLGVYGRAVKAAAE